MKRKRKNKKKLRLNLLKKVSSISLPRSFNASMWLPLIPIKKKNLNKLIQSRKKRKVMGKSISF